MLGAVADQMLSVRREAARETEEREVVRLRAAARENDLVRFDAQERGEPIARVIDRRPRFAPGAMHARRISKMPLEIRLHRAPGRRRRAAWSRCNRDRSFVDGIVRFGPRAPGALRHDLELFRFVGDERIGRHALGQERRCRRSCSARRSRSRRRGRSSLDRSSRGLRRSGDACRLS